MRITSEKLSYGSFLWERYSIPPKVTMFGFKQLLLLSSFGLVHGKYIYILFGLVRTKEIIQILILLP